MASLIRVRKSCADFRAGRDGQSAGSLPGQGRPFGARRLRKRGIERCQRHIFPPRQFQVGGVIDRKPVCPGKAKDPIFVHPSIEFDREAAKNAQRAIALAGAKPSAPFADHEHIADLEPPDARDGRMIAALSGTLLASYPPLTRIEKRMV